MKILQEFIPSSKPTSVALGYFDGVHRGHQAVIGEAVQTAKQNSLIPTVFTLQQSPRTVLRGEQNHNILPLEDKLRLLEDLGVELVYCLDFRSIKDITAETFIKEIVVERFHAKHLSCGFNYHFGAGAQGSGAMLEEMCQAYGVTVLARPRIEMGGLPVSSTRIRGCVADGNIVEANEMLGRQYGFTLPIIHGKQLGRTIGVPTLNQKFPDGLVIPKFGVYATSVTVDGKTYYGATNVGVKPTVGSDAVLIETWLPEYTGRDLYGENIDVRFLDFVRPERKFDGLADLQAEILRNAEVAKQIFYNL